ncbi:MAG: hypothetical protein QNJ98_15670 [Planctomycetota bacterium]|nr:hypothetical protein [Planctomycetota bacterium]
MSDADSTDVRLTRDEALVLFELAWRFSETDELSIAHEGERRALWNLCCAFESTLLEPCLPNYHDLLNAARERLAPSETEDPDEHV